MSNKFRVTTIIIRNTSVRRLSMTDVKCPKDMVYIPGGVAGFDSRHEPVDVSGFCIDKHEVTNAEYSAYLKENPQFALIATSCDTGTKSVIARGAHPEDVIEAGELDGHEVCALEVKKAKPKGVKKRLPSPPGFNRPNQPVVNVNWFNTAAFCESKDKMLPDAAEWIQAAGGPENNEYGTKSGELNQDEAHLHKESTADVCSYPENGYGLCDMAGNVSEWIFDWAWTPVLKMIHGSSWATEGSPSLFSVTQVHGAEREIGSNARGFRCVADPLDTEETDEVITALAVASKDEDKQVRGSVIEALTKNTLIKMYQSDEANIREAAMVAFKEYNVDYDTIVDALISLDKENFGYGYPLRVLGRMGPEAKKAIPYLTEKLKDLTEELKDPNSVHEEISEALKKIEASE